MKTRELPTGPVALAADRLDLDDEAMAESIAEAVPVALIVLDRVGRMEFANQVAREICDLPEGPTFGRYLPDLAIEADRTAVAAGRRRAPRRTSGAGRSSSRRGAGAAPASAACSRRACWPAASPAGRARSSSPSTTSPSAAARRTTCAGEPTTTR